MYQYYDTDHNASWYHMGGVGGSAKFPNVNNPDLTNCALGRIHALSKRARPGFNLGMFSMLDFSYPSVIFDVSQRSYFAHVMRTNASTTPFSTAYSGSSLFWHYMYSVPNTHDWQLSVVTTRANSGDEWPEQAEQNYTTALEAADYAPSTGAGANAAATSLHSSTPIYFRSKGGDSQLAGLPDSAAYNRWPFWGSGVGQSFGISSPSQYDATVTAYGGNPTNVNPMLRGWCVGNQGSLGGINTSWVNTYNNPGWNFFTTYITPPIADTSAPVPGRVTYKYRYPVPSLLPLYAIVYDRDKDLLLVRYPQVFASNPIAGNTRLQNFWKDMNTDHANTGKPTSYVDRRLKVGDSFMAAAWPTPFKVKELLDPATEYANLPAGVNKDAADQWNDGTYQIIRVTPSLSTTTYTANKPTLGRGPNSWTDPAPRMILVAPAPLAGGPSPWVSTIQLKNCNGTVFHDWDNMTD